MARGQPVEIDLDTARRLKAEGVPTAEIARQLKIPVNTLKDQLKRALPVKTTDVYNGSSTKVHKGGAANVHIDIPLSDLVEFQEVLAWWRRRKHLLNAANESPGWN
jgi:hypothetical protein